MRKIPKVALFFETSAVNDRRIVRGIVKYSSHCGPWLFYSKMHPFYMLQGRNVWREKILPELHVWNPDGIIAHASSNKVKDLIELGTPIILQALTEPLGLPSSTLGDQNQTVAEMGAEYLLELGFTNYGFCGFPRVYWSEERSKAFAERIYRAGFKPHVYKSPKSRQQAFIEEDRRVLSDWLRSLPKPVA
ncbi:MAG: hypothetical protein MUO22_04230, partial [Sedimentisphaerales bacterium]|nr:hypothetical protein [Sedimentisphaerales bacterium]